MKSVLSLSAEHYFVIVSATILMLLLSANLFAFAAGDANSVLSSQPISIGAASVKDNTGGLSAPVAGTNVTRAPLSDVEKYLPPAVNFIEFSGILWCAWLIYETFRNAALGAGAKTIRLIRFGLFLFIFWQLPLAVNWFFAITQDSALCDNFF